MWNVLILKVTVTRELRSHLDSRNQESSNRQTGTDLCGSRNDSDLLTRPRVEENVCLVKSGSSSDPCELDARNQHRSRCCCYASARRVSVDDKMGDTMVHLRQLPPRLFMENWSAIAQSRWLVDRRRNFQAEQLQKPLIAKLFKREFVLAHE